MLLHVIPRKPLSVLFFRGVVFYPLGYRQHILSSINELYKKDEDTDLLHQCIIMIILLSEINSLFNIFFFFSFFFLLLKTKSFLWKLSFFEKDLTLKIVNDVKHKFWKKRNYRTGNHLLCMWQILENVPLNKETNYFGCCAIRNSRIK